MPPATTARDATHAPHSATPPEPAQPWLSQVAKQGGALVSLAMAGAGVAMIALAVATEAGSARKAVEVVLGLAVVISGALLARSGTRGSGVSAGLLPGEITLAAALVYLGVAMPAFQHGTVRSQAVGQFIAVVVSLVVGCAGLVYSRAPVGPARRFSFAVIVRDGVLLITGTIVVAIALGQISNPALKPPKWNWISFLGLTVPGMLVLIAREGVKTIFHRQGRHQGAARLVQGGVVEMLLVVGLGIMIFGSNANLALGKNGYQSGLKGNSEGLTLWLGAAAFLIVVRGTVKIALAPATARLASSVVTSTLYVAGVTALIYGERSVQMGKVPLVSFGGALLPATLMIIGGVAVLVMMRPAARALDAVAVREQSCPSGASNPR